MKISYYSNGILQTRPDRTLDLSEVLTEIKRPGLRTRIESLRAERDSEQQEALKRQLPYITWSGVFSKRAKDDATFLHSGLLCLDFDHLDNLKAARAKVERDPYTLIAFTSPRGGGLKVVLRIVADKAEHEKAFRSAAHYFKTKYNLTADESGKDYTRACFMSHDPEAYANSQAPVFDALQAVQVLDAPAAPAPAERERIAKGSRNTLLTSLAGKLRRDGLRFGEIEAALRLRNEAVCDPPLPATEIEALVRSVCRYDPAKGSPVPALKTETAVELLARDIAPITWTVSDMIAEGLAILAGRPKTGKSWLGLLLALCVATGGVFLDKCQAIRGLVLYLALEDSDRRMKLRVEKLLAGAKAPEGFHYSTRLAPLDQGGLEQLEDWVTAHPGVKLIIIDTLGRVRPAGKKSETLYQSDTSFLAPLQAFAMEHHLTVLGIHHQRKGAADDILDTVSGSTGLTGVCDSVMVLQRESRQRADGILAVESRDFESEPIGLTLDKETMRWAFAGPAKMVLLSRQRDAVLGALNDGPMKVAEIADAVGKKATAVCNLLAKLSDERLVFKNNNGLWEKITNDPF